MLGRVDGGGGERFWHRAKPRCPRFTPGRQSGCPPIENSAPTVAEQRTYATNAERSRHHTEDKQRFVVSVVAYDSLPGHHFIEDIFPFNSIS
jgi:hypothetical protein